MTITDLAAGSSSEVVTNATAGIVAATLAGNWSATSATTNAALNTEFTVNVGSAYTLDLSAVNTGSGYSVASTGTGAIVGSTSNDILTNTSGNASFTGGSGLDTFTSVSDTMTITDLGLGNIFEVVTNATGAEVVATLANNWSATSATANAASNADFTINVGGAYSLDLSAVNSGSGYTIDSTGTGGVAGITGSQYSDVITASGISTSYINGGGGFDTINLNSAVGNTVDISNVTSVVDLNQINGFTSGADMLDLVNTIGGGGGAVAALINVAGLGGLAINDVIADSSTNLGAGLSNVGSQSATFTDGGYVYNTTSGALYFSATGNFTVGNYSQVASLTGGATVAAGDLHFGA